MKIEGAQKRRWHIKWGVNTPWTECLCVLSVYLNNRQQYLRSAGAQSHECQIGHCFIPYSNCCHSCFPVRQSDGDFFLLMSQRHTDINSGQVAFLCVAHTHTAFNTTWFVWHWYLARSSVFLLFVFKLQGSQMNIIQDTQDELERMHSEFKSPLMS